MSNPLDLAQYRPGDIVQTRRTLEVARVTENSVSFKDVQTHEFFTANKHRNHGTLRIDMVKRAPRPKPYPRSVKAGDVLTGAQVKARPWKRGTIIRCACAVRPCTFGASLVLNAEARWMNLNMPDVEYEFNELADHARFEIEHVVLG